MIRAQRLEYVGTAKGDAVRTEEWAMFRRIDQKCPWKGLSLPKGIKPKAGYEKYTCNGRSAEPDDSDSSIILPSVGT